MCDNSVTNGLLPSVCSHQYRWSGVPYHVSATLRSSWLCVVCQNLWVLVFDLLLHCRMHRHQLPRTCTA